MKKLMLSAIIVSLVALPLAASCGGGASPSPSPTRTATASPTRTATVTASPTASPTRTATVTASPSPTAVVGPAITHVIAGREDCLLCHGLSGVSPFPANHAGRTNNTCFNCHSPASPTP